MVKILLGTFIIVVSNFNLAFAETLTGTDTDKIWRTGTILDSWSKEDSIYRFSIIKTKNRIWYCRTDIGEDKAINRCHSAKNKN